MNNTANTDFSVTRTLNQGLNGSGHSVWIVNSTWTDRTGRQRGVMETFSTEAEAQNWIKWS